VLAYLVIGLVTGAGYALFAAAFVLVYKGTRVFNLALGEIGGIGVYVAWSLLDHLPVLVACLIGVLTSAVVGAVVEVLLVRRLVKSTPLAALASMLGVALTLAYVEALVFGLNVKTFPSPVGTGGVHVAGTVITAPRIALLIAAGATAIGLATFLRRTRFGLMVAAATSDAALARLSGIPVERARAFVWALAGAMAGLAAILLAPVATFFPLSNTIVLVPAFAAALLGGLTSLPGAFVAALGVGVVGSLTTKWTSLAGAPDLAVLVLLLIGLLLRPQGLFGERAS
jgi:branched-chain amino acid transport system permease protein